MKEEWWKASEEWKRRWRKLWFRLSESYRRPGSRSILFFTRSSQPVQYQLFYPLGYDLSLIQDALQAEQIQVRPVTDSGELDPQEGATALLTPESRDDFSSTVLQRFVEAGGTVVALGTPDESDVPEELPLELLAAFLRSPYGAREILLALRTAYREAAARTALERAKRDAALRTRELGELMRIGMALNTERDYEQLQPLILTQARELSSSDAASLYLVETLGDDKRQLRLKFSQTYSRPEIPLVERTMPIDKSGIAGHVAATGRPLVIDDAYFLPPDSEYTIDRFFDRKWGYRTKSMLTIPSPSL
jgi:hypothetical protein